MKLSFFICIYVFLMAIEPVHAKNVVVSTREQQTVPSVETYIVKPPPPPASYQKLEVNIPGLLLDTILEPLCVITQGIEEEAMITNGVNFECTRKKDLEANRLYTVLRKDMDFKNTTDANLSLYWVISTVSLFSVNTISTGKVAKEILPIESGDWLVELRPVTRQFQLHPLPAHTGTRRASIVAFSTEGQNYGVEGDFVFLDHGRNTGLDVDAVLPVYRLPDSAGESKKQFVIGTVQIIEATDSSAIGYLQRTQKEIPLGSIVLF